MMEAWAAAFLIAAPVWFNVTFALLAKRFAYPDILRRPTEEILESFRAGGSSLIILWWAFMLSGLLMIGAVVLLSQALGRGRLLGVTTVVGILAGFVQVLGLLRWVYLVPSLARTHEDPQATPTQREMAVAIFHAFHQYLGVGVGEHLGYLLTGLWSLLTGIAIVLGAGVALPVWVGWPGILIGAGLIIASAEFLGPNEEHGWGVAGRAVPVLYVAWSVWLVALGIALLV
jgi:hypothetical protein